MKTTRKLAFSDVFKMAKIIGKTGLKKELTDFFLKGDEIKKRIAKENENKEEIREKTAEAQENLGVDFLFSLIEKSPQAEKEIYSFLGSLCDRKAAEIETAEIGEIVELVTDIVATNEDLKSFFISALRSPTAKFSIKS